MAVCSVRYTFYCCKALENLYKSKLSNTNTRQKRLVFSYFFYENNLNKRFFTHFIFLILFDIVCAYNEYGICIYK